MAHEATLIHETPAIGQFAELLNRDLATRRAVYWVYRIETPPKPFDRRYLLASSRFLLLLAPRFFSLLASSRSSLLLVSPSSRFSLLLAPRFFSFLLLLAPRFFSLLASSRSSLLLAPRFFSLLLCMAIATREWRRRRFSPRGFSLRVRLAKFRWITVLFLLSFLLCSRPGVLG